MEDNDIKITVGWRYEVFSMGEDEMLLRTAGTFLGYTALGQDTAMVFELDPDGDGVGKVRLIPVSNIMYLELLERGCEKTGEAPDTVYFG